MFDIPFVPANTFRGGMRREAAQILMDKLGQVDLAVFHGLTCGASTGQPASGAIEDIKQTARMRSHLYMGPFGGGPYLARSGYMVRKAVPIIPQTVGESGAGMVPSRYSSLAQRYYREEAGEQIKFHPRRIMPIFHLFRRDSLTSGNIDAGRYVKDFEEAAMQWLEKINGNKLARDKVKNQKAATKAGTAIVAEQDVEEVKNMGLASMFAVQAIAAGVQLYFRLDIAAHMNHAQVYFIAESLRRMLQNPLGGLGRLGYGVVQPDLYYVGEQGRSQLFDFIDDDMGSEFTLANEVAEYKAEFDAELNKVTHEEMLTFLYFDTQAKADEKAAKAAKKSGQAMEVTS